jgi:hypothetical protein
MKIIVQTDFLCSYYYHAAKEASDDIKNHQLPRSLYRGIAALILWQCVFESYANFQIERHGLKNYKVERINGKLIPISRASIKEKWMHLPIARSAKHFVLNTEPFNVFADLVDFRNDLIHFNESAFSFEKEAPPEVKTHGDLNEWMKSGDFLTGSFFDKAIRYALAGDVIANAMFREYSKLTGDALPGFLNGQEVVLKVSIKT